MFSKLSKHSSVKRILLISLSNIGDVVLTSPVMDVFLRDFPQAHLTLVIGPKAQSLFADHPRIKVIIYDKHMSFLRQWLWFFKLKKDFFDVIVDLRQSALGFLLSGRCRTPIVPTVLNGHMKLKHMERLRSVYPDFLVPSDKISIIPKFFDTGLELKKYIVIAPGAADSAKRWLPSGFTQVADILAQGGYQTVFVGDDQDKILVESIQEQMKSRSTSFAGSIDLRELAFVIKGSQFVLTHDSAVMHVASYFNIPLVALWGPTDMNKYGPWSEKYQTVINRQECPRCHDPKKVEIRHCCMNAITVEDVLNAIKRLQ